MICCNRIGQPGAFGTWVILKKTVPQAKPSHRPDADLGAVRLALYAPAKWPVFGLPSRASGRLRRPLRPLRPPSSPSTSRSLSRPPARRPSVPAVRVHRPTCSRRPYACRPLFFCRVRHRHGCAVRSRWLGSRLAALRGMASGIRCRPIWTSAGSGTFCRSGSCTAGDAPRNADWMPMPRRCTRRLPLFAIPAGFSETAQGMRSAV